MKYKVINKIVIIEHRKKTNWAYKLLSLHKPMI